MLFCLVVSKGAAQSLQSTSAMLENIGTGAVVAFAEQSGRLLLQTGGTDNCLLQRGKGSKRLLDAQPQGKALQLIVSLGKLFGNAAVVRPVLRWRFGGRLCLTGAAARNGRDSESAPAG